MISLCWTSWTIFLISLSYLYVSPYNSLNFLNIVQLFWNFVRQLIELHFFWDLLLKNYCVPFLMSCFSYVPWNFVLLSLPLLKLPHLPVFIGWLQERYFYHLARLGPLRLSQIFCTDVPISYYLFLLVGRSILNILCLLQSYKARLGAESLPVVFSQMVSWNTCSCVFFQSSRIGLGSVHALPAMCKGSH